VRRLTNHISQGKSKRQPGDKPMIEEIKSIEENSTWKLPDMPAGHRPIELKWVYKLRKDANGVIVKHK
jgi:hypothetical protein